MNFRDAILSGKKIRSEYYKQDEFLDSTLFSEPMTENIKKMFCEISQPIPWKHILGSWEIVEE